MLAVLSLAACTPVRETPAPPSPAATVTQPRAAVPPAPKPAPVKNKPRVAPEPAPARATPRATPPPRTAPAINAKVSREPGGQSVLVTRGTAAEPVPLFRQAIVLANVRASVAGLPAPPKAEFQRGLLTLTFGQATSEQIATAVNRAIEVPEVTRLRANLPQ
ncbi:MAG: hypothetical protein WEB31_05580 [Chthoniobacterales bacterium]